MRIVVPDVKTALKVLRTIQKKKEIERAWEVKLCQKLG